MITMPKVKENHTGVLVVKVQPSLEDELAYLREHGYNVSYWVRGLITRALPKAKRTIEGMTNA